MRCPNPTSGVDAWWLHTWYNGELNRKSGPVSGTDLPAILKSPSFIAYWRHQANRLQSATLFRSSDQRLSTKVVQSDEHKKMIILSFGG
jgi:hypothetical protein